MSVYTAINEEETQKLIHEYKLGILTAFSPIESGTVNSNYFLTTDQGEFVLTIFEDLNKTQVLPYLLLNQHVYSHIPVAQPFQNKEGDYLSLYHNKPVSIFEKINGQHPNKASKKQCYSIGRWLAQFHLLNQNFTFPLNETMGDKWKRDVIQKIYSKLSTDQQLLLKKTEYINQIPTCKLPKSIIHADLFKDNTLYIGDDLKGVIDFYYAKNDCMIYDIAIALNDWDEGKELIDGYESIRKLNQAEKVILPDMQVKAALRFWLSRLESFYFPKPNTISTIKDPKEMESLLSSALYNASKLA